MWSEILGLDEVSTDDNFFEIGGHSLTAMLLLTRINQEYGLRLGIRALLNSPTVAELADLVEDTTVLTDAYADIKRASDKSRLFTSSAQQTLWLDAYIGYGKTHQFRGSLEFALKKQPNELALEKALREIVRRHEVLRTNLSVVNGELVQTIKDTDYFRLLRFMRNKPHTLKRSESLQWVAEFTRAPINLESGDIFRAALIGPDDKGFLLVLVIPEIAAHRTTYGIIHKELEVLYTAIATGEPSPLAKPPIQFADFAVWQHDTGKDTLLHRELRYWLDHLKDAPRLLPLFTGNLRPSSNTFRSSSVDKTLDTSIMDACSALAQEYQATPYMLLLSLFSLLLHRYSQEPTILVGTLSTKEDEPEIEGLVGYFYDRVVMRCDFDSDMTFIQLLQQVRDQVLNAYENQHIPVQTIADRLGLSYDPSFNSLFQATFRVKHTRRSMKRPLKRINGQFERVALDLSGIHTATVPLRQINRFDLSFGVDDTDNGMHIAFKFNPDLYETQTMNQALSHFETLIHAVVDNPNQRVAMIPLVTEPHQMAFSSCTTGTVNEIDERMFHEVVEHHAAESPHAPAVICGQKILTYRELNKRANCLARYLRSLGVDEETPIGIIATKSVEYIIAILGGLKAGGACVPITSTAGSHRTAIYFGNDPALLLQEQLTTAKLDKIDGLKCVNVTTECDSEYNNLENSTRNSSFHSTAFFVWSSESNVKPIAVTHQGLVNGLVWNQTFESIRNSDRTLLHHPNIFLQLLRELLWPLYGGATVTIPQVSKESATSLTDDIKANQVTILSINVVDLIELIEDHKQALPISLRRVIYTGDPLPIDIVSVFNDRLNDVQLENRFSLEEAGGDLMGRVLHGGIELTNYGEPHNGVEVRILDKSDMPLPANVLGELSFGGPNLCLESGRKGIQRPLLKTGYLGRYTADGSIEVMGKTQALVRRNGFRIESWAVEAVLMKHPAIRAAVVLNSLDESCNRVIALLLASRQQQTLIKEELVCFLRRKIPAYAMPTEFLTIDRFPLDISGRIDRQSLLSLDVDAHRIASGQTRPRGRLEEKVVQIWSDVLGVPSIGRHDNFFELGGDEMSAVEVASRIRDTLNIDVPLNIILQSATLADMTETIKQV